MLWKKSLLISVISTALYGCGAEEQPYDTLSKPSNSFDKSQLKTDQVYLYMPSMGDAPRYAASMAPFFQGKEKLVVLNFEANESHSAGGSLTVREISPDVITQEQLDSGDFGRWIDRPEDTNLVLSIPVDFVDYQCRENDHEECVNKEEQVDSNEIPWQDRRFFEPDFANVEIAETSRSVLYHFANSCYIKVGSPSLSSKGDWKGYEMADDGSINFEVKQTYRVKDDWSCFFRELSRNSRTNFEDSGLTFTVSQFYSLVPLDSVRSPSLGEGNNSYEPIVYLKDDEDQFGYFTSEVGRPDASYASQQFDQNYQYLNRFNPKLKQIDYHLSDSFDNNEETLFYKRITYEAIERLNQQFMKVGVPLIKLHEPSGKNSGDLRYNVINLIDEPLSNGLAGYGPSAANPLTGEIVHAHVNQYSGVLRSGASRYWDRIVTDYNNGRVELIVDPNQKSEDLGTDNLDSTASSMANVQPVDLHSHSHVHEHVHGLGHEHSADNILVKDSLSEEESFNAIIAAIQSGLDSSEEEQFTINELAVLNVLEQRLWAENNMYPIEALNDGTTFKSLPTEIAGEKFNFDTAVYWKDGLIGQVGQLKTWKELDAKLQERLSLLLSGNFYVKTLVHELGHNLGLRHNFQGSNDADNYFKPEELVEYGLTNVPEYSSIMDYNASTLNIQPLFGPYDLAALRFGYKRQIEATTEDDTTEGGTVSQFFDVSQFDKPLLDALNDPYSQPLHLSDGVVLAFDKANEEAGLNVTRRFYDYCTDEGVTYNDDCNRFDAGRNREEIALHEIERYDDRYYQRTTRGLKENFDESGLMSYARYRVRQLSEWRESLYIFDRYSKVVFSNELSPSQYATVPHYFPQYCAEENANPTSLNYSLLCAVPLAVDLYRDQLLKMVTLPDHTCEITDANGDVSYRKLAKWMAEFSLRNNYPVNHVPTSCYDEHVLSTLESGEQVTGEQGVFLNSGKAPRTSSVNNYVDMFDYYGSWPDKLAAAVALIDRVGNRGSSNRTTLSFFDVPDLAVSNTGRVLSYRVVEGFLDQLILSTFQRPWRFKNAEGQFHRPTDDFKNFSWDNKIDPMPYYGSYSIRQYFGLPRIGEIPLNKAILTAMVLHLAEQQLYIHDEPLARQISVYSQQPEGFEARSFKRLNGKTFFVTAENFYAGRMLDYKDEYEALVKAEREGGDLTEVPLKLIKLEDFQDEKARRLIDDRYNYQKQSLENLPVYNTIGTLRADLLNN